MSYFDDGLGTASLTFLDPDEDIVVNADTQGEEFRFDFTVPTQSQTQNERQTANITDKLYLVSHSSLTLTI